MIHVDLKCAFDSVWHDAVIYKMENMHFPKYIIKIIQSFLSNRCFKVKVNDSQSDEKVIPAGVPQGAVLSPVLFNIFVSDILFLPGCTIAQYADDIAILSTAKRADVIVKKLRKSLQQLKKYFKQWRLLINPTKCDAIFFTKRRAARAFPKRPIEFESHALPWKNCVKYLGFLLDQKLTFKHHI